MEDAFKAFLDQYYPRFAEYVGSEGLRDQIHKERLETKQKLDSFLRDQFPKIMTQLEDESQYKKVYELFDLVAKKSYQAGRQRYLSFFGAKRYYDYSGKKEEPSQEVLGKFQGTEVKENIRRLYNLLTNRSQLPQYFEEFLKIPFVSWNLATAFLMYSNPQEFPMVNEKTHSFLEKLGVKRPKNESFEEYDRLRKICLEIKGYSTNYADGGFKDFLDMDWFEHLLAIGDLEKFLFKGFLKEDLKHFTGKREDARYLQERFKKLKEAIRPMLPPLLVEKLYVARINIQGKREYRDCMWVGTSHPDYGDPREGMQFQFYMRDEYFFAGIWCVGSYARSICKEAAEKIQANKGSFIELVRKLPSGYSLDTWNTSGEIKNTFQSNAFNEDNLGKFVEDLLESGTSFCIGPELDPQETVDKKEKIVEFCAETVRNLLPVHSLVTGKTIQAVGFGEKKIKVLKHVEKVAFAHLLAGKNLVLYGPPGTGKTLYAKRLAATFCGGNFLLRTANAEWTAYDVVGGVTFSGSEERAEEKTQLFGLEFKKGFLTAAAQKPNEKLPCWLIIDEINRANLDLSFGKAFTLLDIDHRNEPLVDKDEYPGISEAIYLPKSFRIIATMNSYDRAMLFALGFAFRRRFAFLELPSPFKQTSIKYDLDEETGGNWNSRMKSLVKNEVYENVQREVEKWISSFSEDERLLFSPFSNFERNLKGTFEKVKEGAMDPYNPLMVMYSLAREITEKGLVELGYAQIVDSLKFVLAYSALEETDRFSASVMVAGVDEAFLAYLLPQFEYILPELRREKISGESGRKIEDTLDQVIEILDELGLKLSKSKMTSLKRGQIVF